jgi:hypothetical protein
MRISFGRIIGHFCKSTARGRHLLIRIRAIIRLCYAPWLRDATAMGDGRLGTRLRAGYLVFTSRNPARYVPGLR